MPENYTINLTTKIVAQGDVLKDWLSKLSITQTPDVNYFVGNLIKLDKKNANNDMVELKEAQKKIDTQKNKMLAFTHWSHIFGHIIDSRIVKEADGENYFQILGIIYSAKIVELYGSGILDNILNGSTGLSMELYFNKVKCGMCGSKFSKTDTHCNCLVNRHINGGHRILRDVIFSGGVFTDNPAEKDARIKAIAEKEINKGIQKEEGGIVMAEGNKDNKSGANSPGSVNDTKPEGKDPITVKVESRDSEVYAKTVSDYQNKLEEARREAERLKEEQARNKEELDELKSKEESRVRAEKREAALLEKAENVDIKVKEFVNDTLDLPDEKYEKVSQHYVSVAKSKSAASSENKGPIGDPIHNINGGGVTPEKPKDKLRGYFDRLFELNNY